jgi:hypothetical protein
MLDIVQRVAGVTIQGKQHRALVGDLDADRMSVVG